MGLTRESKKRALSASLISVRFNHKWCSSTTKLAIDSPSTVVRAEEVEVLRQAE